jgi:hypothetical protein
MSDKTQNYYYFPGIHCNRTHRNFFPKHCSNIDESIDRNCRFVPIADRHFLKLYLCYHINYWYNVINMKNLNGKSYITMEYTRSWTANLVRFVASMRTRTLVIWHTTLVLCTDAQRTAMWAFYWLNKIYKFLLLVTYDSHKIVRNRKQIENCYNCQSHREIKMKGSDLAAHRSNSVVL